jgi:hypothetical protein
LHISASGGERGSEDGSPVDSTELQERREEMEAKKEDTVGKGKLKDYVRWFFVGAFGLILLFTVIMAVYRKYGG